MTDETTTKAPRGNSRAAVKTPDADAPGDNGSDVVKGEVVGMEVKRFLDGAKALVMEDADATQEAILERILQANTLDDILNNRSVTSAKDVLLTPLTVAKVRWMRSDMEEGIGLYALVEGRRDDTDEPVVISCGGVSVMGQLWRMDELGLLPVKVRFNQASRPTQAGFYPLWLEAVPEPF